MLYSEFKKQIDSEGNSFAEEYTIEDTRNNPNHNKQSQPNNKHKKRKGFKAFCIILLCLVIGLSGLLLYYELFNENGIYGLFSKNGNVDYYYALCQGSYEKIQDAITQSDNLKSQGGAGYIYYNGKYNVYAALYLEQSVAEKVAASTGFVVHKIFKPSETKDIPITLNAEYQKCKCFENDLIVALYQASVEIENNKNTKSAQQIINNALVKAQDDTAQFTQKAPNYNSLTVQKYATKINMILKEVEKINTNFTLSNIRHTSIFIALNID